MDQGVSLLSALKSRMGWLSDRQKLVAQNVANASTPGFKPKDLTPQDFGALLKGQGGAKVSGIGLTLTNSMHIPTDQRSGVRSKSVTKLDSETTMDGNSVVLEEQMLRMAESRMQFEAAVGFYQKSLNMMRMAVKAPGK